MQTPELKSAEKTVSDHKVKIEEQIALFKKGTQYIKLLRPATIAGGIFKLSPPAQRQAEQRFDDEKDNWKVTKFVPASGAATRMFKRVFQWIDQPEKYEQDIKEFFKKAELFPFFEDWLSAADRADLETFESGLESRVKWLKLLVASDGMDLARKPKGLIPFHILDSDKTQSPIAEHLKEAMYYASSNGVASVHFTVSVDHQDQFKKEVERWIEEEPFSKFTWEVDFSIQLKSTDTIAVDLNNELVEQEGEILTRPGGHGALIHNLNALDADLVFVKNIDNVAHERFIETTVKHKKVLAGVLLELRTDLKSLHTDLSKGLVDEISINELREKWKIRIPRGYQKLKNYLNRPIRVCGMVKNEGEPGGGPFWSMDKYTGESLQIIEQAQIDPKDARQQNIVQGSTHFNPVDLVCFVRNFKGEKIDLLNYINEDQYFISEKSHEGTAIKALEWPGLWNGAMANWITIFVEVPIITFNPVKEITDLLRKNHLNG
ncbi:MAG: DUF4301 family protein [Salibacteraceae bacterium]